LRVQGRGWLNAQEIEPADAFLSADGRWRTVDAVESSLAPKPEYNVEIEKYHTYFVGRPSWGLSVWAHNADCDSLAKAVRQAAVKAAWKREADMIRRTGAGSHQ